MLPLKIVIPGRMKGKGRGRATIRAGHATVYTPADTVNAEAMVKKFAFDAMDGRSPFEGAIYLKIDIFHLPAPSWSKKRQRAAFHLTGKPDTDNVVKLIGDALNKIVWGDDSQISDLHVTRRYIQSGQERCEITVWPIGLAETHADLLMAAQ